MIEQDKATVTGPSNFNLVFLKPLALVLKFDL